MFSHARTSTGVVFPLTRRFSIPFAISSAMNGKMFGPMAVVTKSASLTASTTASGFLALLIPRTFDTAIWRCPSSAISIS